jgi:hypothetical protein
LSFGSPAQAGRWRWKGTYKMRRGSAGGGPRGELGGGGRRHDSYRDLVEYLASDEQSALKDLGHPLARHRVRPSHALRLVSLGLAQMSDGRLVLTTAGRRALAAILHHPGRR